MGRIKQRIINDFRNGDKDAFEVIFYTYKDILYHISYYYVRDYDDANDCVQDIFIRLVNTIQLYDELKGEFKNWLFNITKTVVLNFIRSKKRYYSRVLIDNEIVENYSSEDSTKLDDTLFDLEILMGEKMFLVYVLKISYDLSFDEIGKTINSSRETARRLYYESLKIVEEYKGGISHEKKVTKRTSKRNTKA